MEWEKEETLVDGFEESLLQKLGMEKKETSLESMKRMAENGEVSAMLWLGTKYMEGKEVEQDILEACYWYEKSNDATGFFRIGVHYDEEDEIDLAEDYYNRAINAESDFFDNRAEAYFSQAMLLEKRGELKQAFAALSCAIQLEYVDDMVCWEFADLLGRELALKNETEEAIRCFSYVLKFKKDQEIINYLLGLCRKGMDEDPETSLWEIASIVMEELANQGVELAIKCLLGYWLMHAFEQGKLEKAEEWIFKAADAGIDFAMYTLTKEYLGLEDLCLSVKPDVKKAREYFEKSESYFATAENGKEIRQALLKLITKREDEECRKNASCIIGPEEGSKMIAELKKQKNTVLVIPDGVALIDKAAFSLKDSYEYHMKYVKKIEKIVIPNSVERIESGAFTWFAGLKEIRFPKNLKWLGSGFADNNYTNFLNIYCRDKRVFDKIEIPSCTVLDKEVFDGIGRIETLVFREGREVIDWNFLAPHNSIGKIMVPQSVKSMVPFDYNYDSCKIQIDSVILPKTLKGQFETCVKQKFLVSRPHIEYYE